MTRHWFRVMIFLPVFVFVLSQVSIASESDFLHPEASGPALRIVFAANSRGLTEPCPVCGYKAVGGLARRATVLKGLRADGIPTLYVSGPYELRGSAELDAEHTQRTADASAAMWKDAQNLLRVTVGMLTPKEALLLAGDSLPNGYSVADRVPVTKRIRIGGYSVAVVFFPERPDLGEPFLERRPFPGELLDSILKAGTKAGDADLVVGVSPWGFADEGRALRRLSGRYDVLLGGGCGAAFICDLPAFAPGIVWSRAVADGHSMMELVFHGLGTHVRPYAWTRDIDLVAREILLKNTIADDKAMRRLLGPVKSHQ